MRPGQGGNGEQDGDKISKTRQTVAAAGPGRAGVGCVGRAEGPEAGRGGEGQGQIWARLPQSPVHTAVSPPQSTVSLTLSR